MAPRSDTEATIALAGGGSAANTACWLAALGAAGRADPPPSGTLSPAAGGLVVGLVAAVGADPLADLALADLRRAGVSWWGVTVADASTGACVVLVDGSGERTMLPQRGANDRLAAGVVADVLADQRPSWVHLSGYSLLHEGSRAAGLETLHRARQLGVAVSVDVASAAPIAAAGPEAVLGWIEGVEVVFANEDEVRVLGGERQIAARVGCLVAKRGPAGARWTAGQRCGEHEAHPAEVLDTTGAGDAFAAGWIAAALTGAAPDVALGQALAAGALAVGQLGARPAPLRGHP